MLVCGCGPPTRRAGNHVKLLRHKQLLLRQMPQLHRTPAFEPTSAPSPSRAGPEQQGDPAGSRPALGSPSSRAGGAAEASPQRARGPAPGAPQQQQEAPEAPPRGEGRWGSFLTSTSPQKDARTAAAAPTPTSPASGKWLGSVATTTLEGGRTAQGEAHADCLDASAAFAPPPPMLLRVADDVGGVGVPASGVRLMAPPPLATGSPQRLLRMPQAPTARQATRCGVIS